MDRNDHRGWLVSHDPADRRYKRLVKELPLLLRALEQAGLNRLPGEREGWDDLLAVAEELEIVRARQGDTSFPGSIYVTPEISLDRAAGWVAATGDAIAEWLPEWIAGPSRSDNLRKLRRSDTGERHLFIIAPGIESAAPFSVTDLLMRSDAPLPTMSPAVPEGVTHVWIMSGSAGGKGFRWSPDDGWATFANDAQLDRVALVGCTC